MASDVGTVRAASTLPVPTAAMAATKPATVATISRLRAVPASALSANPAPRMWPIIRPALCQGDLACKRRGQQLNGGPLLRRIRPSSLVADLVVASTPVNSQLALAVPFVDLCALKAVLSCIAHFPFFVVEIWRVWGRAINHGFDPNVRCSAHRVREASRSIAHHNFPPGVGIPRFPASSTEEQITCLVAAVSPSSVLSLFHAAIMARGSFPRTRQSHLSFSAH
mmetsp:Transcript_30655/g.101985  ORF Transcript_30655/g.101985 Transcript_30655/m.101985 type:complete len:224 (+) Transcript_30655:117-788(+)